VKLRKSQQVIFHQEMETFTLARVLIAQSKTDEAVSILNQLIQVAYQAGRLGDLIRYYALLAIAVHSENKEELALEHLVQALKIGEPEGYIRTFVDLGPRMRELLLLARKQGFFPNYIAKLLTVFPMVESPSIKDGQVDPLVEPLNDRETQILKYMAAGLSDRAIAEALYLSINTVKWYDRQIYSKLSVNRRGEAVAMGRNIGLLK
jgi:LuxR family maltose regulon positive regulatory protein